MEEAPKLHPVHSTGFFTVYPTGELVQKTVYFFEEKTQYYGKVLKNRDLLRREKEILRRGMEQILSEENIIVNGKDAGWEVLNVEISYVGSYDRPFFVFHIVIDFPLRKGRNVYEEFYEPTITEYDYEAFWYFPNCMSVDQVDASGNVRMINDNRIVVIQVSKGTSVDGYESIIFHNNC